MEKGFWNRAIRQANKETLHFIGFDSIKRLIISIILVVIAIWVVKYIGGSEQMNEEFNWLLAVFTAAVVIYVPMFTWNLLRAPSRMEKDAKEARDKEIEKIESTLKEKESRVGQLEREQIPKFKIRPIEGKPQNYEQNELTSWAELEITNDSSAPLAIVKVQILECARVFEKMDDDGYPTGEYWLDDSSKDWNPSNVYWSGRTGEPKKFDRVIAPHEPQYAPVAFHHKMGGGLGVFNILTHAPMMESRIVVAISSPNSNTWKGAFYIGYHPSSIDKFEFTEWDEWETTHTVIKKSDYRRSGSPNQ